MAIPNDLATLGLFQGLQRTLNTARAKLQLNVAPIDVDGRIGSETRKAANLAAGRLGPQDPTLLDMTTSIAKLATNAGPFAIRLATMLGAAPDFRAEVAQRPPLPEESPGIDADDTKTGTRIHWAWWLLGAVGLLGAGFLAWRYFSGRPALAGADEFGYEEASGDFIDV
jgi:hypothetical protein